MMANLRRVLILLVALGIGGMIGQAQTMGGETRPGEWMRDWLVCGPFPLATLPNNTPDGEHIPGFERDYLAAVGGEARPQVRAGDEVRHAGGAARWVAHTTTGFAVNLDQVVTDQAFVLAYAYREIEWPRDETMVLALGSNDGGRAWLNGEEIWDRPEARGLKVDDELLR